MGKVIFALTLLIGLPLIFIGIYFIGYGYFSGSGINDAIAVGALGIIIGSLIVAGGKRTMRVRRVEA
jgi:uncharacterized membrane protein HdeD (DUF308 family)